MKHWFLKETIPDFLIPTPVNIKNFKIKKLSLAVCSRNKVKTNDLFKELIEAGHNN